MEMVAENGFIVLDNSDRTPKICKLLCENDFVQLDFVGTGALNQYAWSTSLFLKRSVKLIRKNATASPIVIGGLGESDPHDISVL